MPSPTFITTLGLLSLLALLVDTSISDALVTKCWGYIEQMIMRLVSWPNLTQLDVAMNGGAFRLTRNGFVSGFQELISKSRFLKNAVVRSCVELIASRWAFNSTVLGKCDMPGLVQASPLK